MTKPKSPVSSISFLRVSRAIVPSRSICMYRPVTIQSIWESYLTHPITRDHVIECNLEPSWYALRDAITSSTPPRARQWDGLVRLQNVKQVGKLPRKVVPVPVVYSSVDDLLPLLYLPNKPYTSRPFPQEWLRERLPEPIPPLPTQRAQGESSPQSNVNPEPGAAETREPPIAQEATSTATIAQKVEAPSAPSEDQQRAGQ